MSRALPGLCLLLALPLTAAAEPAMDPAFQPPPERADEFKVQTKDGCALVIARPQPAQMANVQRDFAARTWGGACVAGYAMGPGALGEMWWGRGYGPSEIRLPDGRVQLGFQWDDKRLIAYPPADAPLRFDERGGTAVYFGLGRSVRTSAKSCMLDRERFDQCRSKKQWIVYSVIRTEDGQVTEKYCPRPRHTTGCEGVWKEMSAPILADLQDYLETHQPLAEARRAEVHDIVQRWQVVESARLAAEQVLAAQREAEQRRAEEEMQRILKETELAEQAAAEAQAAAELAAYRAAEEQFANSLANFNAGQLYALADEMIANGDTERARRALRAIVGRFESHPLAATAVQQLTRLPVNSTATPPAARPTRQTAAAPRFSSICARNVRKVDDLTTAADPGVTAVEPALALGMIPLYMQLYAPCLASDANAREAVRSLDRSRSEWQADCGQPCQLPERANALRRLEVMRRETLRALNEYEYSAELGPVGAQGGRAGAGGSR